ncbi:conserved exported hypothetical protein [Roseovarius sp. EC-HK134]|uniref:hypothetical protein n=1 Tax=unclassified Roseovarius TaxID=2614913 RepID=UPI001258C2C7|nr:MULTISPECIES: hypothetical protein [unclassified Roseovarius]VVT17901.1 conserved exported hypothetical protein [Roseovarius sp. EC-HK134]VVT18268.1 conserved exported hypothetical protein [Roseovarius sp. EC-SD190]
MKKTLIFLVASTALTAAIGVPAWSAVRTSEGEGLWPRVALFEGGSQALPLLRVSDDDDRDDDEDDEDEDEEDDRGGARNPAPASTVAPPQNGLFGTGTLPQVKVN